MGVKMFMSRYINNGNKTALWKKEKTMGNLSQPKYYLKLSLLRLLHLLRVLFSVTQEWVTPQFLIFQLHFPTSDFVTSPGKLSSSLKFCCPRTKCRRGGGGGGGPKANG